MHIKDSDSNGETQTRCQDRSQRRRGRRRGGAWTCTRPRENVWKVVKAALGLVHGEGGGTDGLDPCGVTRRVLQRHSSQIIGHGHQERRMLTSQVMTPAFHPLP